MYEEGGTVYWVITISFVMPLILSVMLLWITLAYQKKKHQAQNAAKDALLREQSLTILSQQNIDAERNRIAGEMHDDLGSGLTTIKFLCDKALTNSNNSESGEIIKIAKYSKDLIINMSEIIWAMNSRFDNVECLIGFIRRYSQEFLDAHDIELYFIEPTSTSDKESEMTENISGEKRRNIYLVVKEILTNIVKYSGAKGIKINIIRLDPLLLNIEEIDGIGFDIVKSKNIGNGLYNIEKRMASIGGTLLFENKKGGMIYTIQLTNVN